MSTIVFGIGMILSVFALSMKFRFLEKRVSKLSLKVEELREEIGNK